MEWDGNRGLTQADVRYEAGQGQKAAVAGIDDKSGGGGRGEHRAIRKEKVHSIQLARGQGTLTRREDIKNGGLLPISKRGGRLPPRREPKGVHHT